MGGEGDVNALQVELSGKNKTFGQEEATGGYLFAISREFPLKTQFNIAFELGWKE